MTTIQLPFSLATVAPVKRESFREIKIRIQTLSLHGQRQAWAALGAGRQVPIKQVSAEIRKIDAKRGVIERQVPTGRWLADLEDGAPGLVGQWPPGGYRHDGSIEAEIGDGNLMQRARGEDRLYPACYLTTSGHAYEAWLDYLHSGSTHHFLFYQVRRGRDGRMHLVRDRDGTVRRVLAKIDGRYRTPRSIDGELMLLLSTTPARISTLSDDMQCSEDKILRAIRMLQGRRLAVVLGNEAVFVRRSGWDRFNRMAIAYAAAQDRDERLSEHQTIDLNAAGYRGSVTDIRDLPRALRSIYRKGDPGMIQDGGVAISNRMHGDLMEHDTPEDAREEIKRRRRKNKKN